MVQQYVPEYKKWNLWRRCHLSFATSHWWDTLLKSYSPSSKARISCCLLCSIDLKLRTSAHMTPLPSLASKTAKEGTATSDLWRSLEIGLLLTVSAWWFFVMQLCGYRGVVVSLHKLHIDLLLHYKRHAPRGFHEGILMFWSKRRKEGMWVKQRRGQ